jgi:hypothetical protein
MSEIFSLIKKKRGSLLLELLIALALMAIPAIYFIGKKKTVQEIFKDTVSEIEEIFQKGYINSILNSIEVESRIFFNDDSSIRNITIKQHGENTDKKKTINFNINIKEKIFVKKCIINGKNEMDSKTKEIWFLIFPDGHSQDVEFTFESKEHVLEKYELNPFSCILQDITDENK